MKITHEILEKIGFTMSEQSNQELIIVTSSSTSVWHVKHAENGQENFLIEVNNNQFFISNSHVTDSVIEIETVREIYEFFDVCEISYTQEMSDFANK